VNPTIQHDLFVLQKKTRTSFSVHSISKLKKKNFEGGGYPMKKDMAEEATSLPALQKIFYPPAGGREEGGMCRKWRLGEGEAGGKSEGSIIRREVWGEGRISREAVLRTESGSVGSTFWASWIRIL
jgi:hypothetical protein